MFAPVQIGEFLLESDQRFVEADLQRHGDISLLALESLVFLFFNGYYNVTSLVVRLLVGHSGESLFFIIRHSLVQVDLDNFLLANDFLSLAIFALFAFGDDGPFSLAAVAVVGGLGDHAWTQLHDASHDATALALVAGCGPFAALAVARLAQPLSLYAQLLGFADEDLLQSDGQVLSLVFRPAALLALLASSAGEHVEDVAHATAARNSALHHGFLSAHILQFALLRIREHIVSLTELLEKIFISALVWVVLHCQFSESFLNFTFTCIFSYS